MLFSEPKEKTENITNKEAPLDAELAEVLGVDPTAPKANSISLHSSVNKRWKHWYDKGLKKEDRELMLEKYPSLEGLNAPKINPEVWEEMPKDLRTKDRYVLFRQQLACAALSAVGMITEELIHHKEAMDEKKIFQLALDAGTLLSDLAHSQNKSRSLQVAANSSRETRRVLSDTKPAEYLFGDKLLEKTKEKKDMSKVFIFNSKRPTIKNQSFSYKPLNSLSLQENRPISNQAGFYRGQPKLRLEKPRTYPNSKNRNSEDHRTQKPRYTNRQK